jgi:ribosome-associated protein
MQRFNLAGQSFIALNNLLKVEGWCDSGGQAKQVIDAGLVTVDGAVELRRRCKLRVGQVVAFEGNTITVVDE